MTLSPAPSSPLAPQ